MLLITHFQDGIAMSTMEAEYVNLIMSIRDLLPFKRLVKSIFIGFIIEKNRQYNINCCLKTMQEALPQQNWSYPE